jgi:DUF1680 family protein
VLCCDCRVRIRHELTCSLTRSTQHPCNPHSLNSVIENSTKLAHSAGNNGGAHANTHIPEIIGSARGYELTSNLTQKAIAENFFAILLANHSWATGGSNDGEHWTTPNRMGDQLNADTEESCTQ